MNKKNLQPLYITVPSEMKQTLFETARKMGIRANHLVNDILAYHFRDVPSSPDCATSCDDTYKKLVARMRFNAAVKAGKIERRPCEICGAVLAEGHHPDYDRLFEVEFLCRQHHMERHAKERIGDGAQAPTG